MLKRSLENSKSRSRLLGFTLVELAVVLVIVGLLVGMGLEGGTAMIESAKVSATRAKLEKIQEALENYESANSRFPCPAKRTDAIGSAAYGTETDCTAAAPAGTVDTGTVRVGVVPIRALNLSDQYAVDAWNQKFLYAVTEDLAIAANYSAGTGALDIQDGFGNGITSPVTTGGYIVVSHGKDRKGAYNTSGAQSVACGATTAKQDENCDDDIVYNDTAYNDAEVAASYFDDFVVWGMKASAAAGGGGGSTSSSGIGCVITNATTTGNLNGTGGTAGGDTMCAAEYGASYKFATCGTVTLNAPGSPTAGAYGTPNLGYQSWCNNPSTNCTSWTSGAGGVNGRVSFANAAYSSNVACSGTYPVVCCKY